MSLAFLFIFKRQFHFRVLSATFFFNIAFIDRPPIITTWLRKNIYPAYAFLFYLFFSIKKMWTLDFQLVLFVHYYFCFWWEVFKLSYYRGHRFFFCSFSLHLSGLRSFSFFYLLSGKILRVPSLYMPTFGFIASI